MVDFDRTWDDYVQGFGILEGEHWLGKQIDPSITPWAIVDPLPKLWELLGPQWNSCSW